MRKMSVAPTVLRNIFGPIIVLLCAALFFALVIFGYSSFEYESEYKQEQEDFEEYGVAVNYEQSRLVQTVASANSYQSKYQFTQSDVYSIISGFLNKTLLTVSTYNFMWVKSLTMRRMYEHSLMLNDTSDIEFHYASTKIVDIVFRSLLPILTTFACGTGISTLHTLVTFVLRILIRPKRHEAWTVQRNQALRLTVICSMAVAIVWFAVCFVFTSFALSKWQDVSFVNAMKMIMNLMSTLPPDLRIATVTHAHIYAAFFYVINTAFGYLLLSLLILIKTWRISAFAIPLIKDIDTANQVDKDVQVKYRKRRAEWFGTTKQQDKLE
ncbi:unnamed protein product [Caenorhabditis sp. 36 PRJEB53466]|nr:unnamed protein product [Caenorhabditis sp. 36 PRJEB53466]